MPPIKVLHITAHLGGGVGKALSGLVVDPAGGQVQHVIACLEKPEKGQFLKKIQDFGCEVLVCPDPRELSEHIADCDVVQLEWWNHPATIAGLCTATFPPLRLLAWCHVSGLHNPIIPRRLLETADKVLFTSPCSYESTEVAGVLKECPSRFDVVHSSGGFDGLNCPLRTAEDPLAVGYLGSLNFAKLHPQYVDFLAAVEIPGLRVRMIGDETNRAILEQQCRDIGNNSLLDFRGYTSDIGSELKNINVLAYLLNPKHYGTTENALLESMAMGIVPVVLDNPAERYLVSDQKTGLVVKSPAEFADALAWLERNPTERVRIGSQAARHVRDHFTVENMRASLHRHYASLLSLEKRSIRFSDIFGNTPSAWFLSCQGKPDVYTDELSMAAVDRFQQYSLYEETKGTVFHFGASFPDDRTLAQWALNLRRQIQQAI